MFNKIIKINELEPDDVRDDIAYYVIPAQELNSEAEFDNQRFGQIIVTAIGKTTNDSYKYYATSSNSSEIKTQIEIIGNNSKSSLIFPVTITSNSIE